ncbi:Archaeal holliday junction resolvase [anaerobic digester metagenome]|jgi:Holliday junction resolvase
MINKNEGIAYEQELVKMFKDVDFTACRLPGSSARSPDIIAGDRNSVFVIEVKTTRDSRVKIRKSQIHTLLKFAHDLNCEARLALRFIGRDISWHIVKPNALQVHEKSFSIDYNTACLKGLEFSELVSNELQKRLECNQNNLTA